MPSPYHLERFLFILPLIQLTFTFAFVIHRGVRFKVCPLFTHYSHLFLFFNVSCSIQLARRIRGERS